MCLAARGYSKQFRVFGGRYPVLESYQALPSLLEAMMLLIRF